MGTDISFFLGKGMGKKGSMEKQSRVPWLLFSLGMFVADKYITIGKP